MFCRDCGFRIEPSLTRDVPDVARPRAVRRGRPGWRRIVLEVLVATTVVLAVGGLVFANVANFSPFAAQLSETERLWCEANPLPVVGAIIRQTPRPPPPTTALGSTVPWDVVLFRYRGGRVESSFMNWQSKNPESYRIGCLLAFTER